MAMLQPAPGTADQPAEPVAQSAVFSMFGGGPKKDKKLEDEDRGDNSGSAKAQREAAAAAKGEGEGVSTHGHGARRHGTLSICKDLSRC